MFLLGHQYNPFLFNLLIINKNKSIMIDVMMERRAIDKINDKI